MREGRQGRARKGKYEVDEGLEDEVLKKMIQSKYLCLKDEAQQRRR